jgi:phosphate:Na+ symporter
MTPLFLSISKMLAGIGFFLLGMTFMEEALRKLAGRPFKIFLRHQTNNKFKAIAGGTIVTAVLQSSSVVNLMVLAFVGAGVIKMQNALAVILGANIGTTLDSWIVAWLGFSFNIELFSLPITGAAATSMALFAKGSRGYTWSKFFFGFGALFIGIDFMKISFVNMANNFDFEALQNYSVIIYVIAGFVITSIIQSSSATVAITLSALNAQAIDLYAATAIVLGSEVGTTIKLLLASVNGVPAKKRVALGNFIYNSILILGVLLTLAPINNLLTDVIRFNDPLMALVFFQSFINVLGVIIFFPFLRIFENFLQKLFTENQSGAQFIKLVPEGEGDLALEALDKETKRFIWYTLDLHLNAVDLSERERPKSVESSFHNKTFASQYEQLKLLHGEIHSYYIGMNKELLDSEERERAEQMISAVRNSMFSAKSIKDSLADIDQLKNSSSPIKFEAYQNTKLEVETLYKGLADCMTQEPGESLFKNVVDLYNRVQQGYTSQLQNLYRQEANHELTEVDISTLINFNREFYASFKAMIWAIKDYLLEKKQAAYFAELPGFIR